MSLSVIVKSASNLPNVEKFSKSDPFTVVTFRGHKRKTQIINNNLDPVWDKTLSWEVSGGIKASECLQVEVYDHESFGNNRLLGSASVSLRDAISKKKITQPLTGKMADQLNATILLEVTYKAPPGSISEKSIDRSEENKDVEGGRGENQEERDVISSEKESDGNEGDVGEKLSTRRPQRAPVKRLTAPQQKLPNKPTDFQVRIHVLEARKLVGSGLNPAVKVACGKETQQTRTQKGTRNPVFDEVLFFNFQEIPTQMFDRVVQVKVFDTRKIISSGLIGSFKFDLGVVYREEDHCFIHKWLLLTDPSCSTGRATGYLKVSIQILGPRDQPKPSPPLLEVDPEHVDIEANLLRPSGVRLVPATLTVCIFSGEDIPQMDSGYYESVKKFLHIGTVQKDLVDPYCTVSFAGHMESTQVIWNEQNPKWNKQINLGVRFPSMCERLRIQMKDRDNLNEDDIIATCYLNMSEISAPGKNGYLPTFGPCFINCYGSPREYSDLPDKYQHLNKGLVEGVAYRGRVMVGVEMSLGTLPNTRNEDISSNDLERFAPFLRRRKYKLFGVLFSATRVYPGNHPVQFELSIGNYGNKQDDNSPTQSSTTSPSNPIYDGNKYYYLPWEGRKPVLLVDSQWEDCCYRMDSLNLILFTVDSLKRGLESAKNGLQMENYDSHAVKGQLSEVLESFSSNLDQPLPELPEQGFTKLDISTREYRMQEWEALHVDCNRLQSNLAAASLSEIVDEVEDYIARLESMACEPQNSVPDVVIWMLSNNKRIAVKRIPSHELMYSAVGKSRGKHCGRLQTIYLEPPATEKEQVVTEGAQVRLLLWLGLDKDQEKWKEHCGSGEIAVFAETYENEVKIFGSWGTTGLRKPHWSDARGKIKQKREAFDPPPPGWTWDGDWSIQPLQGIDLESDYGLTEWTEEVFENQTRDPLSTWSEKVTSFYTDKDGTTLVQYEGKDKKEITIDQIKPPDGWIFNDEWKIDMNRAVDEDGWEYTVEAGVDTSYVPFERNSHLSRRRRWIRVRVCDHNSKALEKKTQKRDKAIKQGWMYSALGSNSYHLAEGFLDFSRRRRYVRKLVNETPGAKPLFKFTGKKDKKKKKKRDADEDSDDEEKKQQVPLGYMQFKDYHKYQLRTYLYQARNMYSSDKTGLSDPYAVISFEYYSARSCVVKQSVCPTWDETVISTPIQLFGETQFIIECPPPVTLEFYDKDLLGKDEALGSSVAIPNIRLSLEDPAPKLNWAQIVRYNKPAGEVLAAFELLLDEGGEQPEDPPKDSTHMYVPPGIRPVLQRMRIEVLCWGVREMKPYLLLPVGSPVVEVECGSVVKKSQCIEDVRKNPNFPEPVIHFEVSLPKDELYCPPLTIRILDKRTFGFLPVVGTYVVKSLKDFLVVPTTSIKHGATLKALKGSDGIKAKVDSKVEKSSEGSDSIKESDFDWWSKYYYSIDDARRTQKSYVDQGHDRLVVYSSEVEQAFNRFNDLVQSFPLYRGKGSRDTGETSEQSVGYFKGSFKAYPIPDSGSLLPELVFSNIPSDVLDPVDVVIRVYIIKGIDLQPQDVDGKSDPYIKVKIGKKTIIDDRDNYIPSNLNPIFGRMFELSATIPLDHTLTISVMDWDRLSADDLIGETSIDLENRLLSEHRALCGLPETYSKDGPNKWRDQSLPVDILNEWLKVKSYPDAEWAPDRKSVTINGHEYTLDHFEVGKQLHPDLGDETDQRLALHILRQQNLVPEHIEARNLYTPMQPGISQGQLHMWVDIFKKKNGVPPPIDVSPRKPEKYLLRIVVWNTKDVALDEVSLVTREAMSDIYVKGWLRGEDATQKTDVHYRSMNGEGNFNWRLVFPMDYLPAENVMVVKKKEHFYSLTKPERHLPPILTMQVWDNDTFTRDDFIGTVDFNLSAMPLPAKGAQDCKVDQLPGGDKEVATTNLFKRKRMKGWWPACDVNEEGNSILKGKMELEFEIVTEEESKLRPAAPARDEPNENPKLEPPNRPVTSFLWLTSPWKAFNFIVWRHHKIKIIALLILLFIIIIIAMTL